MQRATKLVVAIVTIGLATAMFAGAAGAGTTLSKKEYLKQANAACATANKDLNAFFQEFFKDFEQNQVPTAEEQRQAADTAIPIFETAIDAIDALEGPPSLDKKVGKVLDEYRSVLEDIDADPSIVFSADSKDPFKQVDKKAKKLGLKTCAQGGE